MLLKSQMKSLLAESICALNMSLLVPQHPVFRVTCSFSVSYRVFLQHLLPCHFFLTFTMFANTKSSIHLINISPFSQIIK